MIYDPNNPTLKCRHNTMSVVCWQCTEDDLAVIILEAKKAYYAGTPHLHDSAFDSIERRLKAMNPDNWALEVVGTK